MSAFFWFLRLWVMLIATTLGPCATFAYDGQNQSTSPYDGGQKPAIGYDVFPVSATAEEKNATLGARGLFAKFAEFLAVEGGTAYRVMSEAELQGAKVGKYADGPYMNPADSGKKWVWGTKEQAEGWKAVLENGGDVPHVITEIPTKNPLSTYKVFDHGSRPPGPAYLVPFEELGSATPIR